MNEYFTTPLRRIPIRKIDFSNSEDVSIHNKLVKMVTQLTSLLQSRVTSLKIDNKIIALQKKIDLLVYKLYETLTKENIKIIEHEIGTYQQKDKHKNNSLTII